MPTSLTWLLAPSTPDPVAYPAVSSGAASVGDLLLTWSPVTNSADLSIVNNDLAREEGLRTAVLLSLFTDRRAEDGDVLPDGGTDRRGWWADAVAAVDGDKVGSRLWLLARAKPAEFLERAPYYAREALEWLLEDQVAERIDVMASEYRAGWALLEIDIYRPQQQEPTRFKFEGVWRAEEVR